MVLTAPRDRCADRFTVVVGLGVGAWLGPGATGAYGFTGAIGTVAIVIVYIMSNIALIRYFWQMPQRRIAVHPRHRPDPRSPGLAYPLYAVAAPGQAYPYNLVPIVVLVWILARRSACTCTTGPSRPRKSPLSALSSPKTTCLLRSSTNQPARTRAPSFSTRRCKSKPCAKSATKDGRLITVEGKTVFTELAELVDPAHTALILVDMQRDFIDPTACSARLGIDLSMYAQCRPRLGGLLARGPPEAGILVVHIQNTALPGRMSDSPAQIHFNLEMHEAAPRWTAVALHRARQRRAPSSRAEFEPLADELVVRKYRSSGFWGTNLDCSSAATASRLWWSVAARPKDAWSRPPGTQCSTTTTWSSPRIAWPAMTGRSMRLRCC